MRRRVWLWALALPSLGLRLEDGGHSAADPKRMAAGASIGVKCALSVVKEGQTSETRFTLE